MRRIRGIPRTRRADPTAAAVRPTCAAPAATGCSIALPPSKARLSLIRRSTALLFDSGAAGFRLQAPLLGGAAWFGGPAGGGRLGGAGDEWDEPVQRILA